MTNIPVRRGQIWFADIPEDTVGSVQAGRRPVIITQSDRLNRNSPTAIVALVTSQLKRTDDPVHVVLPMMKGLPKQSMVLAEQKGTISKEQLLDFRCTVDDKTMAKVTRALKEAEKANRRPQNRKTRKIKRNRWKKNCNSHISHK